jgi:WD40 repeat protein
MRTHKILAIALALILAGVSCQKQSPAVPPTTVAPLVPTSTAVEPPVVKPAALNGNNLSALQKSASLQASTSELTCAWTSDSNLVAMMNITTAGLYKADSLELTSEFSVNDTSALYDVSADAALVAYSLDGVKIQLYDLVTKSDRLSITPDFQYGNINFTPDGNYLAVDSNDLIQVVFYDTVTGKRVKSLSGFETAAPVYSAEFSPNGGYLIWISRGTAQPMLISDQILLPALSHEDFIAAVRMSHDNSMVATAAAGTLNGTFQPLVTLWNAQNGTVLWQTGNVDYFSSLDFSEYDAFLAAGTMNEVVFYDVASGKELSRLVTGGHVINSLAFSPDGTSLITCSDDGIAEIWKVG